MAKFQKILVRGRQESDKDPELILAQELGPRFMAYRQRFRSAESGHRLDYPLHIDLDVTTVCQLACPMCPAGQTEKDNPFPGFGLFIEEELYLEIIKEAEEMTIPSIRYGLTGEPLLVADLDLWVNEAVHRGFIDLALITNGQLLDRHSSAKLIKAGLTRLMISVDAATTDTYHLVRPGGDFERLIRNIEAFTTIRKELGSILPILRLSFVVMTANHEEVELFREKFSSMADYLSFQDYLNIIGQEHTDFKVRPTKMLPEKRSFFCPDPLTRLAIHADGGLFPCCSDFGRLSPIGNINTIRLKDAWNSKKALELASPEGRNNPSCQRCLKAAGIIKVTTKESENGHNGQEKLSATNIDLSNNLRIASPLPTVILEKPGLSATEKTEKTESGFSPKSFPQDGDLLPVSQASNPSPYPLSALID
jgi:radical SAM protein with 4Fe4S-binding SPASM domain